MFMFHRVIFGFALHVGYVPFQQFELLFRSSVLLMTVRQDGMSPSGNTFPGSTLDVRLDLRINTFCSW